MQPRSIFNIVAVTLVSAAMLLIFGTIISSAWLQRVPEDERAELEREIRETNPGAADPIVRTTPSPAQTVGTVLKPITEAGPSAPVSQPAAPDSSRQSAAGNSGEMSRAELMKKEQAIVERNDPTRLARRQKHADLINKTIRVGIEFMKEPTRAKADEIEAVFAECRLLPPNHQDPDKPLHSMYSAMMGIKDWDAHLKFLDQWCEFRPDSITPLVVRSKTLMRYAWEARGSGFAHTVTDEAWELFHERMKEAADALDRAAKLDRDDGELLTMRVNIAKATGGDTELVMSCLERAAKICPDYFPLYEATAEYLLPRWHGEAGELETVANRLYDDLGPEIGKVAFFRMLFIAHQYDSGTVMTGGYDPAKMRAAAAKIVEIHPMLDGYVRMCAVVAWLQEDQALGLRIRHLLQGVPVLDGRIMRENSVRLGVQHFLANAEFAVPPADIKRWNPSSVQTLEFASDGLLAAGQSAGSPLVVYKGQDFRPTGGLPFDEEACVGLHFLPDGKQFLIEIAGEQTTHFMLRTWGGGAQPVLCDAVPHQKLSVAVSPDGATLVGCHMQDTAYVWDLKSGAMTRKFSLSPGFKVIAFSADGLTLVTLSGRTLKTFDVESGTLKDQYPQSAEGLIFTTLVGRTPDGRFLMNMRDDQTRQNHWCLWDMTTNHCEIWLENAAHLNGRLCRLSYDGKYFIVAAQAGSQSVIRTYDTTTRKLHAERVTPGDLQCAAISRSGRFLTAGYNDGAIRVWKLNPAAPSDN